jgi:hypothetical protein
MNCRGRSDRDICLEEPKQSEKLPIIIDYAASEIRRVILPNTSINTTSMPTRSV